MGSKEKLAELVSGLTEMQAAPLLVMSQAYLQAVRDAETKGRLEVSNDVIKYLSDVAPQGIGGYESRPAVPAVPAAMPAAPVRPAIVPPAQPPRGE